MELRWEQTATGPGLLTGTALVYGDLAALPGGRKERFEPGAFRNLREPEPDVELDIMHQRGRVVDRTPRLELTDTEERLTIRDVLPDTVDGRDAATMVRERILRGLSPDFKAHRERWIGGTRVISDATLYRIGIVDVPAYARSLTEVRQLAEGLSGHYTYGMDETIADSGRVRKQTVSPGAFQFAIDDPEREVNVVLGDSYDQTLGSKQGGSLILRDTPERLEFTVDRLPDTDYARNLLEQLRSGAAVLGLRPLFRIPPPDAVADAEVEEPEEGNPGVFRKVINQAVLTALSVVARPNRGSDTGVNIMRVARPRRRRMMFV